MGTSFLRPDTIDVWRKIPGAAGPTGNVATTPTKLYSQIPALVDHATRGASDNLQFVGPTGEQVMQTDLGFIDGVMPAKFVGLSPGDSFTYQGIEYIVGPNGRGAFVDVQPFDVIVRGTDRYIVLQATRYTDVFPVLQLHLNFGRAWQ